MIRDSDFFCAMEACLADLDVCPLCGVALTDSRPDIYYCNHCGGELSDFGEEAVGEGF